MGKGADGPAEGSVREAPLAVISLKDFEERKHEIAQQLFKSGTHTGFFYIVSQVSIYPCMHTAGTCRGMHESPAGPSTANQVCLF